MTQDEVTLAGKSMEEDEQSVIEQVALVVPTTDDSSLPVYTFRMWTIGLIGCTLLAFLNQFFSFREEPLTITAVLVQIVSLPVGHFMAYVLPKRQFRIPFTRRKFTMNPGPFNIKEHVLIGIMANAGGGGGAYAINVVTIVKAYYNKHINFYVGLLLTLTTQIIGYGWAGIFRHYLVDPAEMWWPANLVQVSLYSTLHEKVARPKGGLTRMQFFIIVLICSASYYTLPGYLFAILSSLSWLCWAWPRSVTAQQLGSGLTGLGIGTVGLDWSIISSYLGSPLAAPWFAIANIMVGFVILLYVITPLFYWLNIYGARKFPIFSSHLFASDGSIYDIPRVVNKRFSLDVDAYNNYSKVHLSTFFSLTYGVGFAALTATLSHVALFHGKVIWKRATAAFHNEKLDIHTKLMQKYKKVPSWWYLGLLLASIALAIVTCVVFKEQVQLPWWGVLLACVLAFTFTLPIGIIAATTNQIPGLNIITEMIMGYLYPGRPIANVCFKTYGYISMTQAVSFLMDFKLGHYMKIPPRSMFLVQVMGTVVCGVVNMGTAWWLLESIPNICNPKLLPANSLWTCPAYTVFYDASVIWGLIGPKRIFGALGLYKQINWFFLIGAVAPVPVWLLTKAFPQQEWIRYINMPILIGATGSMPPATAVNYTSWFVAGFIFSFVIFRYRKAWWTRHNYVLSAGLDGGLAFTGVLLYFALQNSPITWWGANLSNECPLATCPTVPGTVNVPGCPQVA